MELVEVTLRPVAKLGERVYLLQVVSISEACEEEFEEGAGEAPYLHN